MLTGHVFIGATVWVSHHDPSPARGGGRFRLPFDGSVPGRDRRNMPQMVLFVQVRVSRQRREFG